MSYHRLRWCQEGRRTGADPLGVFPVEILDEIFKHLGPDDLGRASMVSRSWREYTNRESFWKRWTPASELLAPPDSRRRCRKDTSVADELEPKVNPFKVMYSRRSSSLKKWRDNLWWSHERKSQRPWSTRTVAIGNGAIVVEATGSHFLSVYDFNDGRYESLTALRMPTAKGQVFSMKALSETLLVVDVSRVLLLYRWTGTDLVFVDGVFGQKFHHVVEQVDVEAWWLASWTDADQEEVAASAPVVELVARALLGDNYLVISRLLEYVPVCIWDVSEGRVVGQVGGDLEGVYAVYGRGDVLYVCQEGLITMFNVQGRLLGRLPVDTPDNVEVAEMQLQFNESTLLVVTVDAGEVASVLTAWTMPKDGVLPSSACRPHYLEDTSLRVLHPSRTATVIHDAPYTGGRTSRRSRTFSRQPTHFNLSHDVPGFLFSDRTEGLSALVAVDLRDGSRLWETRDPVTRPFWGDPHYLLESRYLVLIDEDDPAGLHLIDTVDGSVATNSYSGHGVVAVLQVTSKFIYCCAEGGGCKFIVFT